MSDPSFGTVNVGADESVALRILERADLEVMSGWTRHADPRLAVYDIPAMLPHEGDAAWERMHADPTIRHLAGIVGTAVRAYVVVRRQGLATASIGITMDAAYAGRGYGRRILRDVRGHCRAMEALDRLTLEVHTWNVRAIRAYMAAGFVACEESNGILTMEAICAP